jgi:hypothetical protein
MEERSPPIHGRRHNDDDDGDDRPFDKRSNVADDPYQQPMMMIQTSIRQRRVQVRMVCPVGGCANSRPRLQPSLERPLLLLNGKCDCHPECFS